MITVRCKECGKELISTSKIQFCGCPNQMSVVDNKVGAKDMDKVVMVTNNLERKIDSHFSRSELLYQEERRKRKVRRLDFEVKQLCGNPHILDKIVSPCSITNVVVQVRQMHPDELANWVRIKEKFEENGTTDNFFYQRACAIVSGLPDPMDKAPNVSQDG